MSNTKTCANCQQTKPLSSYRTSKYRKDGSEYYSQICQACKFMRRYYKSAELREAVKRRSTESQKRKNKGDLFAQHLRRAHNIEPEQYVQMLIEQDYKCAICETEYIEQNKRFHVDHDHLCCPDTGSCGQCVRGLLCSKCNLLLGHAEQPGFLQWLERAHQYLEHHG